ncbi:NUDIX domain-containing protein [Kineosporia succinea]|uniref:ADP-ribose pyrophosphatase YjhB (NUDIX family) n=1 Tax=Kineosporia succinea TaxID=84632 RepID=A0ABT9P509_9ACTN|nr:NUDIX hydrolase [Kineosporia succinea]MDP9827150.1 ADP-ribose pyrophosphatase YjhB (NUDIX family) [Kineosporia succinea]
MTSRDPATGLPTLDDDLFTEGEPEAEFNPGIASRLPRKNVAAAALIRDEQGRVLLLEATYKPTWVMPGGVVEADEDPRLGCGRELEEELGLRREPGRLLVVDWVPRHGVWGDQLQFVFDGGVLDEDGVAGLVLQESELRAARFVAPDEFGRVALTPSLTRRLERSVEAQEKGTTEYTTYGRLGR